MAKLVDEFTTVVRDLRILTWPEEKAGAEQLRCELDRLREAAQSPSAGAVNASSVSEEMDSFVGSAVRKNYLPGSGRFVALRRYGEMFRESEELVEEDCLYLSDEEAVPAGFLGSLLERGSSPGRVFNGDDSPAPHCALDAVEDDGWLDLLEHAFSVSDNPAAVERIWTCGLTDAGLHNSFLSEERGLELFDLGEPHLVPVPAFLTKFLMSFFHSSGMEDPEPDDGSGAWVNRFRVSAGGGRLELTEETRERIPYLYDAFNAATDQFLDQLFGNDVRVRRLLVRYVVLQLLSDAAFCLKRWESKGGGTERYGDRVSVCLEKWLWRSLWDVYIASHVHSRMLLRA